jgi:MFS family permease
MSNAKDRDGGIVGGPAVTGITGQVTAGQRALGVGPSTSEKILFWASFFTLIAAGMGFSVRNDILDVWGRQFGFTQTDLGTITGMGFVGFGITIIAFSFFADIVGYGWLMLIAFLLHVVSVLITLAAPFAFHQYGKDGAYWCLYIGAFSFSLANGTCEAVINPLTATLFPSNKTHWLNILHAGWPGGLVLGTLVCLVLNQVGLSAWEIKWGIILLPMLLYGAMMIGRPFPRSEAHEVGIAMPEMMAVVGMAGTFVVALLAGIWLSLYVLPDFGLPGWPGWLVAGLGWAVYGMTTRFAPGYLVLAFLYVLHAMIGYVELGTDSWIVNIGKTVLASDQLALLAFIWTNVLMFTLRFFAGPIVHKISPVGLLFASAVIGTAGLYLLGMPLTDNTWMWLLAATVYGIGKTFYWPTMLGVISECFPRGGALALGLSGGIGMISAGVLGTTGIGYKQDYLSSAYLRGKDPSAYKRYIAEDKDGKPEEKGFLFFPKTTALDNAKVGVLKDDGKILREDLSRRPDEKNLQKLEKWWKSAEKYREEDEGPVKQAVIEGGKGALAWTAAVPAAMALGYLLLIFYFLARGGYKAEVLVGHAAQDEKFTGGVEGPGEG